jgi:hypothetical protein
VRVKNPPSLPAPHWLLQELQHSEARARLQASAASSFLGQSSMTLVRLSAGGGALQVLDKKDDGPSAVATVLKFLKYTPEQIDRMEKLIGTVAKVAATVSWVFGAITSIKDVLTSLGVLEEDDQAAKLQQEIAVKVDAIYKYLLATDRKLQFEQATGWRIDVQRVRTSIANLALSRTQENLSKLWDESSELMRAIGAMLDLSRGDIAFVRQTYGGFPSPHTYVNELPQHWTDYAFPFWMTTTQGVPVENANGVDLASRIWDPGYYIDVLIEAIGVRIAALTALEPAFRSTAQDRGDLRAIHVGLKGFIDKWEQSLFKTTVVGPLDPQTDMLGEHRIHHPWIGPDPLTLSQPTTGAYPPALPLGVIDPVSGVTAFDPFWRDGLVLSYRSDGNYWVVDNYAAAVAAAYARQSQMLQEVRELCGLNRLRTLLESVYALIGVPGASEFVSIAEPGFSRADITGATAGGVQAAAADEEVGLGIIGDFAGKPGKKYKARRHFQYSVKTVTVPMARRMDWSRIQLGYRLHFRVGPPGASAAGSPIDVNQELVKYSAAASPFDPWVPFPTAPLAFDLTSDAAGVYEVLQSGVFSEHEESLFDTTGSVPGKQRLLLDRRSGSVRARVEIAFAFDAADPNHPFVGSADLKVGVLDPRSHPGGFLLDIDVYETRNLALGNPERDEVQEVFVERLRLHFAPSFLVVEPDYFKDREAGLEAMGAAMDSVSKRFSESKLRLGPLEPIELVSRAARYQELVVTSYTNHALESPEAAAALKARFAVPSVSARHG